MPDDSDKRDFEGAFSVDEKERLNELYRQYVPKGSRRTPFSDIDKWKRLSLALSDGHTVDFYDFTNVLSVRDFIQEFLDKGPPELINKMFPVVDEVDRLFISGTQPSKHAIFGVDDPTRRPWYNRVPKVIEGDYAREWLRYT